MSGIQFQLPTLFADWQVRNEKDVQDLITFVKRHKTLCRKCIGIYKETRRKWAVNAGFRINY